MEMQAKEKQLKGGRNVRKMTEYEAVLLTSGGTIKRFSRKRPSGGYHFAHGVLPVDKTWQVALLAAACAIGFCVLFVRWWQCV